MTQNELMILILFNVKLF